MSDEKNPGVPASLSRFGYLLGLIIVSVMARYFMHLIELEPYSDRVKALLELMTFIGGVACFVGFSIERAKAAGKPAWVGWLILVPIISAFALLYLLFVPSRKRADTAAPPPVES